MEKLLKLLNKYVADIAVMNTKLHNLHWNVVGQNFVQAHLYLEKLYDDLFEKYDQVAERIKMLGGFPDANNKAYLDITTIKELPNKNWSVKEALEITREDYKSLLTLVQEIRSVSDQENESVSVMMSDDHIAFYEKELWFMNSMLK